MNTGARPLLLCLRLTCAIALNHTQCHPAPWHPVVGQGFVCFQGHPGWDSGNCFLDTLPGSIFPAMPEKGNLGRMCEK